MNTLWERVWAYTQDGVRVLVEHSAFLIVGSLVGFAWANLAPHSYHEIHGRLHFLVNDILMVFFFALAGKEIREATLPGGALAARGTAMLPLLATLGGMLGPALIYLVGSLWLAPDLARGWAIPMATDIAFAYLIVRFVLPSGHPAIVFLLMLAIADDAGGLLVLAAFYPIHETHWLVFLAMNAGALGLAYVFRRFLRWISFWPYLVGPGVIAWYGFFWGGVHPALALVPLMWMLPHGGGGQGPWAPEETQCEDTLNRFGRRWKVPVELILGLFGLVNAGVALSAIGMGTWLVLAALLLGKPLGVVGFASLGRLCGLSLPKGMTTLHLLVIGMAAATGFTVALLVSTVSFPAGLTQDAAKMGAVFSFVALPLTWLLARWGLRGLRAAGVVEGPSKLDSSGS